MFKCIEWKAFLRASSPRSAEKILRRVSTALDAEIHVDHVKPYWKMSGVFEARFVTELQVHRVEQAVFLALRSAQRLSHRWSIQPPQDYAGDKWDFSGWLEGGTRLSGLNSAAFEVSNPAA